jgi:hypothetical protein
MSMILPSQPHAWETQHVSPTLRVVHQPAMTESEREQPKVLITGDFRFSVTESEAALHPIIGHYRIQTAGMQKPLYMLWHAEGQVLPRHAPSTSITFDVSGARAGETRTFLVAVQVAEQGGQGRVVQRGVFVQVVVTRNYPSCQSD